MMNVAYMAVLTVPEMLAAPAVAVVRACHTFRFFYIKIIKITFSKNELFKTGVWQ